MRGKGLMMGMRLLEMELCDALDVVHVLFEEDVVLRSKEEHASKHHVRGVIYNDLYEMDNTPYERSTTTTYQRADGLSEEPVATGPSTRSKPYIPPTDPMELQSVLGPPME